MHTETSSFGGSIKTSPALKGVCASTEILLRILAMLVAVTAITACTSLDNTFKQDNSPLPIEVQQSKSGQITSYHAHETLHHLYVSGTARSGSVVLPARVDVKLIDPAGKIVDENSAKLRPQRMNETQPYEVRFRLEEARQALKIRVSYQPGS